MKITICIEDGLVQDVSFDDEAAAANVEVVIRDYDIDGLDEEALTTNRLTGEAYAESTYTPEEP